MDKQFPITKQGIKDHLSYDWWKYLLVLALGIFGWNLIFHFTAYRSPEHLKVSFHYAGYRIPVVGNDINQLMEQLKEDEFSDMEVMEFLELPMDDPYYSEQTLLLRVMNHEVDLFLMDENSFRLHAPALMLDLAPYVEDGTIQIDGVDPASGYLAVEGKAEKSLCGIPADSLKKFYDYGIIPEGYYLCVPAGGGNVENAIKLLNYFFRTMK